MKKYLSGLLMLALVWVAGCATASQTSGVRLSKAEMSSAEKKLRFLKFTCINSQGAIPAFKQIADLVIDGQEAKMRTRIKLDLLERRVSQLCLAVKAEEGRARSAGENFLTAEMTEFRSIVEDLNKWEYLKNNVFSSEYFKKNPALITKVLVLSVSLIDDGVSQLFECMDLINDPAHEEEISGLKEVVNGVRPTIRRIIVEAKELEKKKLTFEELEKEFTKIAAKLMPAQMILKQVNVRFAIMYFDGFTEKDKKYFFPKP